MNYPLTRLERDLAAGVQVPPGTRVIATRDGDEFWARGERGALISDRRWRSDKGTARYDHNNVWAFDISGDLCGGLEYESGYRIPYLHEDEGG